jgi:hypothetical protein
MSARGVGSLLLGAGPATTGTNPTIGTTSSNRTPSSMSYCWASYRRSVLRPSKALAGGNVVSRNRTTSRRARQRDSNMHHAASAAAGKLVSGRSRPDSPVFKDLQGLTRCAGAKGFEGRTSPPTRPVNGRSSADPTAQSGQNGPRLGAEGRRAGRHAGADLIAVRACRGAADVRLRAKVTQDEDAQIGRL